MKTAVSIPDELFKAAEKRAKKEKVSRSRLYAEALAILLRQRRDSEITDEMNLALENIDQTPDPAWEAARIAMLKRAEWK